MTLCLCLATGLVGTMVGLWMGSHLGMRSTLRIALARMTGAERDAFLGMLEREPLAPEEVSPCSGTS